MKECETEGDLIRALSHVIGVGPRLLNKIIRKVEVRRGQDGRERIPCFLWHVQRARISFRGEKVECARFVYGNLVGDLSETDRVFQTCHNPEGMRCLQPGHLRKVKTDKESDEWRDRNRERKRKRDREKKTKKRLRQKIEKGKTIEIIRHDDDGNKTSRIINTEKKRTKILHSHPTVPVKNRDEHSGDSGSTKPVQDRERGVHVQTRGEVKPAETGAMQAGLSGEVQPYEVCSSYHKSRG